MPKIGEIQRGSKIGKANPRGLYIFHACVDCGKGRWVRLVFGKPESKRCLLCVPKSRARLGSANHKWKGGRTKSPQGYISTYLNADDPHYPMASINHYVLEHRLIMAKHLGRCLHPWEIVHHNNGVRDDNRIDNLELLPSPSHHLPSIKWQTALNKRDERIASLEKRVTLLEAELVMARHDKSLTKESYKEDEKTP